MTKANNIDLGPNHINSKKNLKQIVSNNRKLVGELCAMDYELIKILILILD